MGRVWDIIPPHPPPRKQTITSRKKRKNASLFFMLIIIIFVGLFLYTATIKPPASIDGVATLSPSQSTLDSHQLLIKILNGTGRSEETGAVTKILTDNGFKVTKMENALNLYDQTIVYYEPNQEKYAQEIVEILTKYQAKIQPFTQESSYDLIVVIGSK